MRHVHPPTSAHVDITVAKNASFAEAFQFDEATVTTWDFNSKTFRLDIKGNFEQTSALISITSGASQITVDDAVLRILTINVPDTDMQAALVPGCYVYDLIMTDAGDVRTQLMHGDFFFAQAVTGG